MKKRLKGLIALIMAITMVMSVVPNVSYGAISDEEYEKADDYDKWMYLVMNPDLDMEEELKKEEGVSFGESEIIIQRKINEYYNEETPYESVKSYFPFYEVTGFTIYGVDERGNISKNSEDWKKVGPDYQITDEDIKLYGNISGNNYICNPYLVADLQLIDYNMPIYDEKEENVVSTLTYNIEIDNGENVLEIPEGYIGYMLHQKHICETGDDGEEIICYEPEEKDVFICSYADLVREMYLGERFGYEFEKLVPTKKMPFILHFSSQSRDEGYEYPGYGDLSDMIWLEPGENIAQKQEVKDALVHSVYSEDIEWTLWTIWYCGGAIQMYPEIDYENNVYETFQTTPGTDVYSASRIPMDENFYYTVNYPVLSAYVPLKDYDIPYYEMDGTRGEDFSINEAMLGWTFKCECGPDTGCYCDYEWEYTYCDCQSIKNLLKDRYQENECPETFKFEYDGIDYGIVSNIEDIWWRFIYDGNYDLEKAKLSAVCKEHDYDYENGKEISKPTLNENGKTEYTCKICGTKTVKEDVEKLISINSVTLSNTEYTYNGKEFKPTVTVKAYVDSKLVTLTKEDYTVTYKNNKNAGTATVTVTGKGEFAGTKTVTFKINPIKITSFDIDVKTEYTGKAITGKVTVRAGTTKLLEGNDYTVTYKNNKEIGVATVTVKGKNNYTGTLQKTFTIKPNKVTGLKQNGYSTELIELKWNKVSGATKYQIFKKNTTTGKLEAIGTSNTNRYTVKKLKAGSNYTFAVRAYKEINRAKIYGDTSESKTLITKSKATKISVKSNAKKKAVITWTKVTGAEGYEIYMSNKKGTGYSRIVTAAKNKTNYTKTGLTSNKTYYFKVRSYRKNASGTKVYSAFSSVKSVKVK